MIRLDARFMSLVGCELNGSQPFLLSERRRRFQSSLGCIERAGGYNDSEISFSLRQA